MTTDPLRLPLRALAVAGLLTMTLVGCQAEPTAAPTSPPKSSAAEIPTDAPTDLPPGMPAMDTFVFAHPEDAGKMDPSDVTDGESLIVNRHVYEGLTRYKSGTTEVEPSLAISWTASADNLSWTFALRSGVQFHDGTPFDAAAVVWNFNRWFDKANPFHFKNWEFAYWADMFQGYKDVDGDKDGKPDSFFVSAEAVDPATVKLTLSRPNAPLLQTLAMLNFAFSSPKAVEGAMDKYGTPDGKPIEAGTGPYMVDSWTPKDNIALKAFDGYWGTKPTTPNLVFRVIPDGTARFLSLQKGEIDGMNQMNPEDIANGKADANVKLSIEPANNVGYLGFNQAHKPWNNLDCRLAVSMAIDKQAIVDSLFDGDAEVATQMLPPLMWGHNSAVTDYPFDVAKAKDALKACLAKEKLPESVVFYVPSIQRFYFPKPKELGETIQAALSELGITTKIESPDWKSVWLQDVRAGKADLFLLGWGGDNGDPDNYLCVFFCGGDGAWNSDKDGKPMPPDADLNKLLREAATLSDQAARKTKYEEASQKIHDLALAVPLVHRTPPLAFRANVDGYTSSPIEQVFTSIVKNP